MKYNLFVSLLGTDLYPFWVIRTIICPIRPFRRNLSIPFLKGLFWVCELGEGRCKSCSYDVSDTRGPRRHERNEEKLKE